ncbi:MAG: hypothetical protein LBD18_04780 [Treponema sp.]|jgi:hypothetical protein|nr:hypothetical protein [Treponema sp.]
MNRIDITGKKYGRLTVLFFAGTDTGHRSKWRCQCECGKILIADGWKIRNGHTQSCGCLQAERVAQANTKNLTKHGMSCGSKRKGHRLYKIWRGMIDRCENQNVQNYQYYGARGISVCKEWRTDFLIFYTWAMRNGYSPSLSIDRKNVNENYCPENCRWATPLEQANNKRNSIRRAV